MTLQSLLAEPGRVQEPQALQDYSDVLTQVASKGTTVIVCRNGAELAAIIPIEQLELIREVLARQDVEQMASQIDWSTFGKTRPPQEWFEENDSPFEAA